MYFVSRINRFPRASNAMAASATGPTGPVANPGLAPALAAAASLAAVPLGEELGFTRFHCVEEEEAVAKEEAVASTVEAILGLPECDEPREMELDGTPLRVAERVLVAVAVRVIDPLAVEVRVCDADWDADTVDVGDFVAGVELGVADCDGVGASTQTRVRLQPEPMQLRQLLWPNGSE